jgi:hypothetical protein
VKTDKRLPAADLGKLYRAVIEVEWPERPTYLRNQKPKGTVETLVFGPYQTLATAQAQVTRLAKPDKWYGGPVPTSPGKVQVALLNWRDV